MDIYNFVDLIPLTYQRVRGGAAVTGLTVTVSAVNAVTKATLLSTVACPEIATGAGIYNYTWVHGLTSTTECLITFTVSGQIFTELILITNSGTGGRAV